MTREKLDILWIGVLFISIPLALDLLPPNSAFGFKTAKTFSSPEVWREANTFLGWALITASLIGLGITYFKSNVARKYGTLIFLSMVVLAVVISYIYLTVLPG